MNEDLTGGFRLQPDPDEVRAFCDLIHEQAARAFADVPDPGLLQLSRKHPAHGGLSVIGRYAIGESERMAADALIEASNGFNVYIEGRTVRRDLARTVRGGNDDTRGVFALVIDSDADKGRQTRLDLAASLRVESSPGNAHLWLFFARALTIDQVAPHAEALRHATGADSDTANPSQPYRLAGTPNFPDAKKRERGRIDTPTKVLEHTSHVWTLEDLQRVFPPVERVTLVGGKPQGGRDSIKVERILATTGGDRSERFYLATRTAFEQGLSAEEFEALCLKHPNGCAGRFATRGALRADITRIYGKAGRGEQSPGKAPAVERVAPTYADNARPVAEARKQLDQLFTHVAKECTIHESWINIGGEKTTFPVMAFQADTGTGKSESAIRFCTRFVPQLRINKDRRAVAHMIPNLKLAGELLMRYRKAGLVARVVRGRDQPDPDQDGKRMCHDMPAVRAAIELGASVKKSCCIGKNDKGEVVECPFKAECGFFRQLDGQQVDVWIVAHNYLFTGLDELGKLALVIVDESFIDSAIWSSEKGLTIDEIETSDDANLTDELRNLRAMLGNALRMHDARGGAKRETLAAVGLSADLCAEAGRMEWKLKQDVNLYPGMPDDARKQAAQAARQARFVRQRARIWDAAKQLLGQDATAVSGRLILADRDTEHGRARVVQTSGVRAVATQFRVPTVIMDATLPDTAVLQAVYPNVERLTDISATMPHVAVRQVIGAPVSGNKLGLGKGASLGNRACEAMLRYIRNRHAEFDRKPTLVVARKEFADWLRQCDLPDSIAVEHFNNVAGLDQHKHVRLLISIGGTAVEPLVVEREAGTLRGTEPQRATIKPNGSSWYDRTTGGVRLPDGSGVGAPVDRHPDALAEAIRWQKHEAGILQAIGRGRGVNRDASSPLQIDILANVVLPLTVRDVVPWSDVLLGKQSEMALAGVIIENAADMSRAFPTVWKNAKAAENYKIRNGAMTPSFALLIGSPKGNEGVLPDGWIMFEYRRDARGAKIAYGIVNQGICPEPRLWLEERLGPLAHFQIDEPPVVIDEGAEREREPSEPSRASQDAPAVIASRKPPVVDGPSPPPPR